MLTGKPWIGDEAYREYAEVFREYLDICVKGVNYLKGKKLLLDDMGFAYDEYLRSSRRLTGLELELIRDTLLKGCSPLGSLPIIVSDSVLLFFS